MNSAPVSCPEGRHVVSPSFLFEADKKCDLNYPVCKVVLALCDEVSQDYFLRQVHTLEVAGFFKIIK
jgi:hypothetical protein